MKHAEEDDTQTLSPRQALGEITRQLRAHLELQRQAGLTGVVAGVIVASWGWPTPLGIAGAILVGVLAGLLNLTKRVAPTYWHAAAMAALAFTVLLSAWLGVGTGLLYIWPFFVYATCFLAWQLESDWYAWGVTMLVQVTVNLLPTALLGGRRRNSLDGHPIGEDRVAPFHRRCATRLKGFDSGSLSMRNIIFG